MSLRFDHLSALRSWLFLAAALVCGGVPARAEPLVPGTGTALPAVGDNFEDEDWEYIYNSPKSTYDNVRYVKAILEEHRWSRILLVSSPYHMRRAMMTWRREAPGITVVATPPPQSQFYDHERGATLEQIRGIVWEYLATFAYWRRGWL